MYFRVLALFIFSFSGLVLGNTDISLGDIREFVADIESKQKIFAKTSLEKDYTIISKSGSDIVKPCLYILVSNSMPEESLRKLALSSNKIGLPLTIRGFINNSIKDTVTRAKELFLKQGVGEFSVDPELFESLQIKSVPAFVIRHHETDIMYGDISLDEALRILAEKGSAENSKYAENLISRVLG